jgi:hypothetical protein
MLIDLPHFDAALYARLMARVLEPINEQDCWRCTLSRNRPNGYCQLTMHVEGERFKLYAHVAMFELFNGPVPDGHEVDHVCWHGDCINPDHLRALPLAVNRARNQHAKKLAHRFSNCYSAFTVS